VRAAAAAIAVGMSDAMRTQLEEAMRRGYVAAYRLLGNADAARDACQEAAARALGAAHRYDPARPFYPWFHRILRNRCLDDIAARKRLIHDGAEPVANERDAEHHSLLDERARAVSDAIAALDDELRAVVELRHFEDASYEEMADILDIPIGTVMSRLYRARKALRAKLRARPGFEPGTGP
jgi:RNA polymerase sigma-70 factor (ECF subfamily)